MDPVVGTSGTLSTELASNVRYAVAGVAGTDGDEAAADGNTLYVTSRKCAADTKFR